jgi:hypothetical protein
VACKGVFRVRVVGPLLVGLVAAALAVPAADAGLISGLTGIGLCPAAQAVQPFAPWSDYASYELAPNGGFESGATSWTLTGAAKVVAGNESFYVNSKSDTRSLALPAGSSATSGAVCVGGLTRASVRLFVASGGSTSATLQVQVVLRSLTGALLGLLDGGTVTAGPAWSPTPVLLALQLPLGTSSVQLKLSSSSGTSLADDVYVDPWLTS